MTIRFDKDRWILNAIRAGYLQVGQNGVILRCTRADKTGNLLSNTFAQVTYQTHKKTGRVYFNMTWRGFTKSVLVNRVVALRWLPNPDKLPQVNHIDGNKANNALSNLEWSSGSDNEKHAHRTGLKTGRGSANSNAKLDGPKVLAIRASTDPEDVLAARYGVSLSTIKNVRSNRTWKHLTSSASPTAALPSA